MITYKEPFNQSVSRTIYGRFADDDYIGDVALSYAEFAGKVYSRLKSYGWTRNFNDAVVKKYFNVFKVTL